MNPVGVQSTQSLHSSHFVQDGVHTGVGTSHVGVGEGVGVGVGSIIVEQECSKHSQPQVSQGVS